MEPMKPTRRTFSVAFKKRAIKLVKSGSKEITKIARELGVSRQLLYQWVRQADQQPDKPLEAVFPGRGKRTPEQMELDRLRRENAELRDANEFLKKAKAFFAKNRR